MTHASDTDGPVQRNYDMRLVSHHGADENELLSLDFDLRPEGGEWRPLELSVHGSPFLNFLHSAFTCQLAYLRMNAAERQLRLKRVHGLCRCESKDFKLTRLVVSFAMELEEGEASSDDLRYIRERCMACPVSRNLPHVEEKETVVTVGNQPELP